MAGTRVVWMALCGAGLAALGASCIAIPSGATTATATLLPGPLGVAASAPRTTTAGTANGWNEATATQVFDVTDATGSGAGWSITVSPSPQSTASAAASTSVGRLQLSATAQCDGVAECSPASEEVMCPCRVLVGEMTTLPIKVFDGHRQGDETVMLTWGFALPVTADRAPSTYVVTLVTGP